MALSQSKPQALYQKHDPGRFQRLHLFPGLNHFQLEVAERIQQVFQPLYIVIDGRLYRDSVPDGSRTEKRNQRQKNLILPEGKRYADGTECNTDNIFPHNSSVVLGYLPVKFIPSLFTAS